MIHERKTGLPCVVTCLYHRPMPPRLFASLLICVASALHGESTPATISFTNDVMPQLQKAGCSAGTCHSKPEGQNNFKLSVFGYDPKLDYDEIVTDDRGRRVFPSAPEESLLLKKATGQIPHEGGVRFETGSEPYKVILAWMRAGMPYTPGTDPKLTNVSVQPRGRLYKPGAAQQLTVTATYSDGSVRDVSRLAEYISQDKEMATVDEHGLVTVGRLTGEGVIVLRYMGLVDVVRITVPAEKILPPEVYARLPVKTEVDTLVYERLQKLGIEPSAPCTDEEFLRRASLDAVGVLPSPEKSRAFLASTAPDKRDKLIDELLEHPNYANHWAIKWGDLIRPNPSRVGVKPVLLIDAWLRDAFRRNMPYNEMVRELLTASGSTHEYGPVAFVRDKREPIDASSFVSQIFLGVRMDCAKCHHHPNEKWTQEDYYQMAAFFAQMKRKGQGISAPISGEPEYWWYAPGGSVTHPVTDAVMIPKPPDGPEMPYVNGQDPRKRLADWMEGSDNPFFAKAITNRIWAEFFGRGIVDPVDDFRVSNPATNEPLMDWLARDFVQNGYDLKHLMRILMRSNVYQLSSRPNASNLADSKNFSRAYRRRLSAEVLADAVNDFTGGKDTFAGLPLGSRAVTTWNHKLESDFLDAFGRPNASQECPCERDKKSSVVQALHLMNSQNLQEKLAAETPLKGSSKPEPELVRDLYLAAYNRLPRPLELKAALAYFATPGATRQTATEDIMWSLVNSAEFVFNH
ncbi:MAG: hypothetical protein JWO94_1941 [Verrucomicrobiaceae bacterium]|nr:hypothetical protein [Verrucomicrobiaceae bacterium]